MASTAKFRKETADFIASMLDLFEGQLSLDDILRTDYWLLTELAKAKEKLLKAKAKARADAMAMDALSGKR